MSNFSRIHLLLFVLAIAVGAAACGSQSGTPFAPSGVATDGSLRGAAPGPGFVDPNPRQPNVEYFEVCKDYVGTSGPAVSFTFQVDVDSNGSIDATDTFALSNGQCTNIWASGGVAGDTVTVTESVPAGYSASYVKTVLNNGTTTTAPSVQGNSTTDVVRSGRGVLVVFTNTAQTTAPGDGRFTGGGSQIRLIDNVRVTRGLTIHCDLLLSNNLEVNWGSGNKFHMDEHLATVACTDDPAITQAPPAAPLDTLIGRGTGSFNGTAGYTVEFTLVDYGEPGSSDRMALKVYQASNPGNVVLDIPLQVLVNGNLQAHFDQPHK